METFILPGFEPECTVTLPPNLTKAKLLDFVPFKTWCSTFRQSLATQASTSHPFFKAPYQLKSIDIQVVDYFGPNIGFLKFQTVVSNEKGEKLPGAVFMRGGSVGMLVILQPDDVPQDSEQDKQAILTIQPRVAGGSLAFAEIPAGMLDNGTFTGQAAQEIKEETGLDVQESELTNMTELAVVPESNGETLQKAMYPSPGGCDEYMPLFLCQKRLSRARLNELRGALTGLRSQGEKITLKLVSLEDLWKEGARDGKTLAAWALYCGLKAEGKIRPMA